jgi:Xaa-Pro aminopeptidase
MRREGVDVYLVPSGDAHGSEYVGAAFREREYLTGFTGSAGTLVVTMSEAGLWTDGRYFIQADKELSGSGIILFRAGEPKVPTIKAYLKQVLKSGQVLGFDGRVISAGTGLDYEQEFGKRAIQLRYDKDLVTGLWQERPRLSCKPLQLLGEEWSGQSVPDKLQAVRAVMAQEEAGGLLLTRLDDLMWLFNVRGGDVPNNPVALSYGYIGGQEAYLFVQDKAVTEAVRTALSAAGVTILAYEQIYEWIKTPQHEAVMVDRELCNYTLYKLVERYARPVLRDNPTVLLKAVKNPVELDHIREVYRRDSIAVIRFMIWIKERMRIYAETLAEATEGDAVTKAEAVIAAAVTEAEAAAYLDRLRGESEGFWECSFPTICASGANAAMMHYEAKEGSCKVISPDELLLVDSGGQYFGGTTDVTRTLLFAPRRSGEAGTPVGDTDSLAKGTSDNDDGFKVASMSEIKRQYTAVVRGLLGLSEATFCYGCTGRNLDILARGPLWAMGIDYKCGTGHGIGYMLNVHEGPQNIRWAYRRDSSEAVLEAGMLISNEPGVYREGSHGIRIENIMVVKEVMQTDDGRFMGFETLTLVPIEREGILVDEMTREERGALNRYHQRVYDEMSGYLNEDEREWLAEATKPI